MTRKLEICIFLHAYQPPYPAQDPRVIERITRDCYNPFFQKLLEQEQKITLNISACLLDTLNSDSPKTIDLLKECAEKGLIEFLCSGTYHPIFPLIRSKKNRCEQINTNIKISRKILGSWFDPTGFFPPELAISEQFVRQLADAGFRYVLVPQNSVPLLLNNSLPYITSVSRSSKITILSRNKHISNDIAFRHFGDDVRLFLKSLNQIHQALGSPPIIGMDIETFGEHHSGYLPFLFHILEQCKNFSASELVDKMADYEIKTLRSSSWSTSDEDLERNPFPLWSSPNSVIHSLLNTHFMLLDRIERFFNINSEMREDKLETFRDKRLRSQFSCQLWWGSGHGRSNPRIIQAGLEMQRDALRYAVECLNARTDHNTSQELLEISDYILEQTERTLIYH